MESFDTLGVIDNCLSMCMCVFRSVTTLTGEQTNSLDGPNFWHKGKVEGYLH